LSYYYFPTGLTSQKGFNFFTFLGTLFAIPLFVTGLSQAMVIATTFVIDTWKGSKFMKTVTSWDNTLVDWFTLLVFFGLPVIIGSISLIIGFEDWWTITSISWCVSVFAYYIIFAICAVCYEVDGCLELVRYHPSLRAGYNSETTEYNFKTFYQAIQLRMKQNLSGYVKVTFITHGNDAHPGELTYKELQETKDTLTSFTGLWGRFTQKKFMSKYYTALKEPTREYSVDDVLDFSPYVTRTSWSLESIYCRNRNTRYIAIINGASALTRGQTRSSFICFIFGKSLTLFAIVSLVSWFNFGGVGITVTIMLYILSVFNTSRSSIGLRQVYSRLLTRDDGNERSIRGDKNSDALYQFAENFRITEPNPNLCWIVFAIELVFFYIVPIIALFAAKNYRVGGVFIFMGLISMLRHVFNAPACLKELGNLDGIEINNIETDGLSEWREKHRLGKIVSEISVGKRSNFWLSVLFGFVLVFGGVFLSAIAFGSDEGVTNAMQFASKDEFYYEGSSDLNYASCSMGHNIKSPDKLQQSSLADFAFLSTVAYLDDNTATQMVGEWFGDTVTENLSDNVDEFVRNYQEKNGASVVSYKLFDFPEQNLKIVSVRGTSNSWDALADAQLWSSAALAQLVRGILPFGEIWTQFFPYLVNAVSFIEAKALTDVSYYKETTEFVKSLKEQGFDVQIVGHCKLSNYIPLLPIFLGFFLSQSFCTLSSSWRWTCHDHWSSNRNAISWIKRTKQYDFTQDI
jgi:hypothetical protein